MPLKRSVPRPMLGARNTTRFCKRRRLTKRTALRLLLILARIGEANANGTREHCALDRYSPFDGVEESWTGYSSASMSQAPNARATRVGARHKVARAAKTPMQRRRSARVHVSQRTLAPSSARKLAMPGSRQFLLRPPRYCCYCCPLRRTAAPTLPACKTSSGVWL